MSLRTEVEPLAACAEGTRPRHGAQRLLARWRPLDVLFWLALPLAVWLVPLAEGYAWNSINPGTPNLPGNASYRGRTPDEVISIEVFGTSVIAVPYPVRLREYVLTRQAPLWNPYQGLGQPLAAQGDGSPYFPLAIARALLPYTWGNLVTVAGCYLAGLFTYLLLRGFGLSKVAALFGGMAYETSGALTLHMARPNIADQLCMVPVLFWACARAVRDRTLAAYVLLAFAVALDIVGGFIQISVVSIGLVFIFGLFYAFSLDNNVKTQLYNSVVLTGMLGLGACLVGFYILPIAEIIQSSFNVRTEHAAFLQTPYANIMAFFWPKIFGPFFRSWVPGSYPDVVDWNNLYAYGGTGLLLLLLVGWAASGRLHSRQRWVFHFFGAATLFLVLRYASFPPVVGVNALPVLNRLTPKHSNGVMVFCLVIAATFGLELVRSSRAVRVWPWIAGAFAALVVSLVTLIEQRGGLAVVDPALARGYAPATLATSGMLIVVLLSARAWRGVNVHGPMVLVAAAVLAELSMYVPLGNANAAFLNARLGTFVVIGACGLLLAMGRRRLAIVAGCGALSTLALLTALPPVGLPRNVDLTTPPPFMASLGPAKQGNYRTFGILPEFSAIDQLQDLDVVGPFSPTGYANFVQTVSSDATWSFFRGVGVFFLSEQFAPSDSTFKLSDYLRTKPIFDWLGMRFLVLDKGSYSPPAVQQDLLARDSSLRLVYQDDQVSVVESPAALPRATFAATYTRIGSESDIVTQLRARPEEINDSPRVQADSLPRQPENGAADPSAAGQTRIDVYRADFVQVSVEAPSSGLLILKDAFFPGWRATVDGAAADVVQVNGMVRGVLIPRAGSHVVQFQYLPESFVRGLWLAGFTALLFAISLGVSYTHVLRGRWGQDRGNSGGPG